MARLRSGRAAAPKHAPLAVKRAIWAANQLRSKPYRYGGGHKSFHDRAYDCSGTISYVLGAAGLQSAQPSFAATANAAQANGSPSTRAMVIPSLSLPGFGSTPPRTIITPANGLRGGKAFTGHRAGSTQDIPSACSRKLQIPQAPNSKETPIIKYENTKRLPNA